MSVPKSQQQRIEDLGFALEGLTIIAIGSRAEKWVRELVKDIPVERKPVARGYSLELERYHDDGNPNF
jgi:hypothetical protein